MKDINAITALIIALSGLLAAIGGIIALLRRTKKIDVKVNGHLTHLLDILDHADIKLPSGAVLKYAPPEPTDPETANALQYLAELRKDVESDTGQPR